MNKPQPSKIVNPPESETKEFPQGKDSYCPQCYFEDDIKVLRKECKHAKSTT